MMLLMNKMLVIFIVFLLTITDCQASSATDCLKNYGRNISHFAVLPGFGWDNLRNVEVSRVVEFNYSECQLTNDGLYFLPNGIDTIPLKQSTLDQSSEIFQTFTEYSSATAKSVNENTGFHFPGQRISGAFSDSFLKSRNIQIMEKSVVVRSQIRYVKYKAKLQPDAILSPAFKLALLSISRHVLFNRTEMARYESQVLVRDFGTHVITSLDAGAALVLEDHLKSEYFKEAKKENILLGAGASLSEVTGVGMGSSTNTNPSTGEYKTNLVHSFVQTYGGSMFMTGNGSSSWSTNLENHLVAVDREGIPLYNFVNLQTLPSIPSSILYDVTSYIENAVKSYYVYNSYPGCTNAIDSNFNSQTNFDDGSCNITEAEVYFGGIFQMCDVTSDEAGDVCSHLKQPHLKSQGFICQTGFQGRLIYRSHYSKTSSKRVCKKCYAFFNCCEDEPISSSADLKSFWCAAESKANTQPYYFSGVYSSILDNVFTKSKSCPLNSHSRLIGDDIHICLSDEESSSAVKFGGMFSCLGGNSLATESANNPKACPKGFSARLAGVIQDCAIHYCVPLGSLPIEDSTVTVRRPPFAPKIKLYPSTEGGDNPVYDPEKQEWLSDLESRELKETESVVELSAAEAAVIAIFVTIIVLVLLGCIVYFYRKSQRRYPTNRGSGTSNGTVEANL
ncbi:hypothetical protein LOTGIDRAFT_227813 [Lottia gigantea]|uniref:MACPF domain-containing protein n=1 Tax=Lottia gigantea TaxID=225164 RepID=V4BBW9_LOTGI|nr:hypothetical protein LOTGIDRAFT_227813 [Lottia gigantea]ESP05121.1 hypothetical protein LOTGIDRAFT_227813 [Lottia gigantea]